jgi:ABC-type Fe3+-hydroxamate transport system substrate-binding protein
MTRPGSTSLLFALLLAAGLAGACASMGSASISEVRSNPSHFENRTVTVTGVVTTSWGIPLVPYRMYRVSDGQSDILVVSDGRRTPTKGARVRVKGRVEDVAVLGGRPLGLHLREKSLKVL